MPNQFGIPKGSFDRTGEDRKYDRPDWVNEKDWEDWGSLHDNWTVEDALKKGIKAAKSLCDSEKCKCTKIVVRFIFLGRNNNPIKDAKSFKKLFNESNFKKPWVTNYGKKGKTKDGKETMDFEVPCP